MEVASETAPRLKAKKKSGRTIVLPDFRTPLLTPFNGQPPICDGLFKKNLRDTSLKLNHVAMAMRFRFASSRLVLFEFGSFHRLIEVPFNRDDFES
jgi:hypothetical protein